jgi:5-oxoprolinase (ATP-hydrolysing)
MAGRWQFWIDRGGTFTDIVAKTPDEQIIVHKLLSEKPDLYQDAAIQGIREIMGIATDAPIPVDEIEVVKMGTTVATNALLEKKGDRTVLLITKGFRDALRIGYQNRPDIFALEIILPEMLYEQVIEVEERYDAQGKELIPVNLGLVERDLQKAYDRGIRSCAIVLMHGYRHQEHEKQVAAIAKKLNFSQISVSHQVSPLMKLVSRGDTTVVDAYLSPILRRYVDQVAQDLRSTRFPPFQGELGGIDLPPFVGAVPPCPPRAGGICTSPQLMFMQSNGGLVDANLFQGKDSLLSGPAGGVVGAVKVAELAGLKKIISFDMGGTSTDVAHYGGEYERTLETEIAGVRFNTPMMSINTVAAGGGSIIKFDGSRYRVGPESAGAIPGPACYSQDGPLTITDCNVMVGKLQAEFFPKIFGKNGNLPLNIEVVKENFQQLTQNINDGRTTEQVAAGFLAIAVEKMANAIKKISLQRGYDVSEYTLCCFGAAGGQHACLIADALGIKQILIHPFAGVLSAYGIGLADIRILRQKAVESNLTKQLIPELDNILSRLLEQCQLELSRQQTLNSNITTIPKIHLKYLGTDSTLTVNFSEINSMRQEFEQLHQQRYGFIMADKELVVQQVSLELICPTHRPQSLSIARTTDSLPKPVAIVKIYTADNWHDTPVYKREDLQPGDIVSSPALIIEKIGTNIIEPGWQAELTQENNLILKRQNILIQNQATKSRTLGKADPVMLEIFNNLFRFVAEQMGTTLQNTSYSVNIKERLDFSCAIFDKQGELVANAPHIPVHLGSMSESVSSLIKAKGNILKQGDVYMLNNPYNGGTHLPDVTVITPVFLSSAEKPLFYVASRGHHADLGGITPGSMPPQSTSVEEEGILIDNFLLVENGRLREQELFNLLTNSKYPVRNFQQNLADLQAQIAANAKGLQELLRMVEHYGTDTVKAYMSHVQNNAEESVRRVVDVLKNGGFVCELDNGSKIQVTITVNRVNRAAKIDFTGTSPQLENNFNAPTAVTKAVVLYVFRTLVKDDIPLNSGCLKPLEIIIPECCMLNPKYPAAVVAGNVETSQNIADCLYGALGVMAAAQGTMNNFTFGNAAYQYYETICGGSGAGINFNGTDAVHTQMTNSRLTDPEVLEWRFPVILESFSIRPHSGGKGRYSGGNGVIRRVRFLESMTAGILSSRRNIAPFGLFGGGTAMTGKNYVDRSNGVREELGGVAVVAMQPGDILTIETPGGGGYGVL